MSRSSNHFIGRSTMNRSWNIRLAVLASLAFALVAPATASAQQPQQKPNILVIMGDDIGYWNISAYNRGMMGYRTPNIDRIAGEGALFTDYYGQQSCTAGRAALITGQSPMRTGLLKVGLPGAKEGLSDKDPTLAELLKPLGYVTGQFGKNHLGDRNEFLPTVHGFDEFFGNLYHLNAEDEPEHPDYPKNPTFRAQFGPRGDMNTNWEGGYRVPAMVRWPGLVPPRTEINDIFSAEDWATTLVAAAGEPNIKDKLLQGYNAAGKNFRVHLDGYDQRDLLSRKGPNKRREFFYWTDDGNLAGLRYEQWKAVFLEQKAHGFDVWAQPMVQLRLPMLFNLRSDPFERAQHEAGDYVKWFVEHAFVLVPAQSIVAQHLASFQQFPPRQRPGSFSVEQALEKLRNPPSSN